MPRLLIDQQKLTENYNTISQLCLAQKLKPAFVTKMSAGNHDVLNVLYNAGCRSFCESRIDVFANYPQTILTDTQVERLLVCLPYPEIAEKVVEYATASLNSDLTTIKALNAAMAKKITQQKAPGKRNKHKIILMLEAGDRREGILASDLIPTVQTIVRDCPNLHFMGIGANFNCLGGVISDLDKMLWLQEQADALYQQTGILCETISGGNSGAWHLIDQQTLPPGINQLRLGELLFMGRETSFGYTYPYLHQDIFQLAAPIIEISEKPFASSGQKFFNAAGEIGIFNQERGVIQRLLLNCGAQDFGNGVITPTNPQLKYLANSGDHTLVEIISGSKADFKIGEEVLFNLNYTATNSVFLSPLTKKELI